MTDSALLTVQRTKAKRLSHPKSIQLAIFRRDQWLCYWCKRPVIFAPAMKFLEVDLRAAGSTSSLAYYHAHWTRRMAPLLDTLGAVLDHLEAFSVGGLCDVENLVTACTKCNARKSAAKLTDWEKANVRRPIRGKYGEPENWDGLSSTFVLLAERYPKHLSSSERQWFKALQ
jgi:5-methylcytosine-specific restriction endonuclease McrA